MKISKVNQRRTAVAVNNVSKSIDGILYVSPVKKDRDGKLQKVITPTDVVVDELIKNSVRLYSPFNSKKINIDKRFKAITRILKQCYINFVKNYVKESAIDNNNMSFNPNPKYISDKRVRISIDLKIPQQDIIEAIVNCTLRRSLKRNISIKLKSGEIKVFYVPDLVKNSIKIYCLDDSKELQASEMLEMYALFSFMYEDCYKEKHKKSMILAIDNQKTKVKVVDVNGSKLLKLSVAASKKKPLWDFMVEYANADNSVQDEMLRNIKRLIVLFVCRIDNYDQISSENNLDIWSWKGYGIQQNQLFISIQDDLLEKYEYILPNQLRKANMEHYIKAVEKLGDDTSKFWFQHFENTIENLFSKKSKRTIDRTKSSYLCEYLWKDFFAYIATKFTEFGKGVYHFTIVDKLEDVKNEKIDNAIEFGVVSSRYNLGISSFDYERITAEEELERNIATYTTFATNVFAKAVVYNEYRTAKQANSDVLIYEDKLFNNPKVIRKDAVKRILQYWGGESRWLSELDKLEVSSLCIDIKKHLSAIRNSSVHYTAKTINKVKSDNTQITNLFKRDCDDIKNIYAGRYYSNNVWMFYKVEDINKLISFLYNNDTQITQVPAFNNIIKTKDIPNIIQEVIHQEAINKIVELEQKEQYRLCLYFMLKEIYYNSFIKRSELKNEFVQYVIKWHDKENEFAIRSFRTRVTSINGDDMSLGDICQTIMTDYNLQNQGNKSIKSAEQQKELEDNGIKGSYRHFPLLLYKALRELFIIFLKNNENLLFIHNPTLNKDNIELSLFQSKISDVNLYMTLKEKVKENSSLLDWYVLAHFLMPKQLNYLKGDIKNYIQFINNIDKRAESVKNNKAIDTQEKSQYYKAVVSILDFSLQYIGRVSNVITDYFDNENEYAEFLSKFVDFGGTTQIDMKAFCQEKIKTKNNEKVIGLYCDEINPIMNRNIAYVKMYSSDEILSKIYTLVTKKDIENYYNEKDNLSDVFNSGVCQNESQQVELIKFQQLKNHIELTEVSIYTDILNDFMAQLISWAYLRERDLMYFQLGIHYIRLFYNDKALDDKFYKLYGKNINIKKGALLYQIVAMYSRELFIYTVDKNGIAIKAEKQGSTGPSILAFVKEYCNESMKIAQTYSMGIKLFENINRHEQISGLRNDIAHIRYMSTTEKSIMDIISEVHSSFFTYDKKLKKSISFIFKNILMKYGVVTELSFSNKDEELLQDIDKTFNQISISKLYSDKYTYKLQEEIINIEIRNDNFLKQLKKLLELSN